MKGNLKVYIGLLLAMFFWGMSFIWYKSAYPEFKPITVIFFRLLLSFPLLFLFSLSVKRLKRPKRSDIKYFLLLAFFEPFLYFIGESFGVSLVSATLASIIVATIPLFTPIIGYYLYKENLNANNYLGMLVSFLGVIMVVYVEGNLGQASPKGIALMFMGVFSTLGFSVMLKNLSTKYNALTIVSYQNLAGAIYFLPLFLLTDAREFSLSDYVPRDFLPLLYLAVFASTIAFILFVEGIKALGISKATVFTNFVPVVTALFTFLMAMEQMTLLKAIGIIVTIFGLFMSQAGGMPRVRIYSRVRRK